MKRKKLSKQASKRNFKSGNGVKSKNALTVSPVYRGGIRL